MKRFFAFVLIASLLCAAYGCGSNHDGAGNIENVRIDYGHSELYTREDMDEAIRVIEAKFRTWKGCELHSIRYLSDEECNEDNLAWMNELEAANDAKEVFTQCIFFESAFHSPKHDAGAWNADEEYTHWHWCLARADGGAWKLMTWGYA